MSTIKFYKNFPNIRCFYDISFSTAVPAIIHEFLNKAKIKAAMPIIFQ